MSAEYSHVYVVGNDEIGLAAGGASQCLCDFTSKKVPAEVPANFIGRE
jgi:hypothetical protein